MDYARPFAATARDRRSSHHGAAAGRALESEIAKTPGLAEKIWQAHRGDRQTPCGETRAKWRKQAEEHWDSKPMTVPRLALEVWDAIKGRLGPHHGGLGQLGQKL